MTAKPTASMDETTHDAPAGSKKISIRMRERAILKIRDLMAQFDIGYSDINPPAAKLKRTGLDHDAIPPKLIYRDPKTKRHWNGIGDAPKWLLDYETNGQHRRSFLIKQGWGRVPSVGLVGGPETETPAKKSDKQKAAVEKAATKAAAVKEAARKNAAAKKIILKRLS